MKIRRDVLEQMVEKFKHRQYLSTNPDDEHQDVPYTVLFERVFEEGHRMSGDYGFCFKWRAMGGKIYVNPDWYFVHEGAKEYGGGTLGDWWRTKYGAYEQIVLDQVKQAKEGKKLDPTFFKALVCWADNDWSATEEFLFSVYNAALHVKGPCFETGSGLTTICLALASLKTGNRTISLEHDPNFLAKTENMLRLLGLNAEVRFAPLKDMDGGKWYDAGELPNFALAVCDGPPRKYGRSNFYRLEQIRNAVILADDMSDPKEKEILAQWTCANDRKFEILGEQRQFAVSVR
jgi:hypothetical protein